MTWLLVAVAAQFILGTSAVFDKLILKRGFLDPWAYTFWLGLLGLFSLVLLPFGFHLVPLEIFVLALLAGAAFLLAVLFMFLSLHRGEASETLPIIGGLSPIFTLFGGILLLEDKLSFVDLVGFGLLVGGSLLLFLLGGSRKWVRSASLLIFSAMLFGFSNVLTKLVFDETNFATGFILIKLGGFLVVLMFLASPLKRLSILRSGSGAAPKNKAFYLLNRGYAGVGSLLVNVAIFLAHPALVDATQSLRYIIIFLASWFLLKEVSKGKMLAGKIVATVLVGLGFLWLGVAGYARNLPVPDPNRQIAWGVTFSDKFAVELGLNPEETFDAIIDELHPKKVRLIAYWDEIEENKGTFNFSELDEFMRIAEKGGAGVILAMGMKTPRWPECHVPSWTSGLTPEEKESAVLDYLRAVVERYRGNESVTMWQVENEPFLFFGRCPGRPDGYLQAEVDLVKSLDSRQIITTDGGETGMWWRAAKYGDVFGSTMYRRVYPVSIGKYVGVIDYPVTPNFFRMKEKLTRFVIGDYDKPFIIIELQAEPWGEKGTPELSYERQMKLFSLEYFKETINFAKDTGFGEYYLWRGEWWYWLKVKYNDDRYWNEAKEILK